MSARISVLFLTRMLPVCLLGAVLWGQPSALFAEPVDEAFAHLGDGQFAQAASLLGPLYESDPTDVRLANALAVALHESGSARRAQQVLDEWLRRHPDLGPVYTNLQEMRRYAAGAAFAQATGWEQEVGAPELAILGIPRAQIAASATTPAPATPSVPAHSDTGIARLPEAAIAPTESVEGRLRGLIDAWSAGDAEQYVSFYGPDYVPEAQAEHARWVSERRRLVRPDRGIRVEIDDLQVSPGNEPGRMVTRFRQYYSSKTYQDVVVKEIVWQNVNGRWRVASEGPG